VCHDDELAHTHIYSLAFSLLASVGDVVF